MTLKEFQNVSNWFSMSNILHTYFEIFCISAHFPIKRFKVEGNSRYSFISPLFPQLSSGASGWRLRLYQSSQHQVHGVSSCCVDFLPQAGTPPPGNRRHVTILITSQPPSPTKSMQSSVRSRDQKTAHDISFWDVQLQYKYGTIQINSIL